MACTELLAGLIAWVRDELGFSELRATVHRGNLASCAMLQRQGFLLRDASCAGDLDTHLYVADLSDYP